ncbi:MAG: protein BatD [Candidatus Scalindua sp. AMX11]|nr:MAG: protein BatD [Candidatus Scalindua sp.]NOG85464.1 protein BatD [Planctomycetota bacterium]RZV90284.1 MAG: protein BatD [Candidatus Scalindua sp. SCAELEC01]TDE64694.1 MAG: protein BatD [Candidatus Scalindua sp. AMX11]GJQ60803.1 MAG: aerotolerance-like protein [Candidatus Scalindua sp.]
MKLFFTFVISLLLLTGYSGRAFAEEIRLTASVDNAMIEVGNYVRLTIEIHGAFDTDQPKLPELEGFSKQYGPSITTQTRIINNAVSINRGFTYMLVPNGIGKYSIPPATLKYKGKTYTTDPIEIEVVERKPFEKKREKPDMDINKKLFIELTTDKNEAYIYEQIILSFKFFFQKGLPVEDLNYVPPSTKSFLAERLGDERRYEEVREGILYSVIELQTALFPVVSGTLEIPPANFKCNIIVRQQSSRRNPFGESLFDEFLGRNDYRYPVERETNSIKLEIKSLPEKDKPDDFADAVGNFTMDVTAKPAKVNVGDPITVTIKIAGKGNIKTLGEPLLKPEGEDDYKFYSTEAKTTITDKEAGIRGEKVFNKVIEPQHENIRATPMVSFSYFDPVIGKYQNITHEPIPISVENPETEIPLRFTLKDTERTKGEVKILTKDILPIMTNVDSFNNQGRGILKRPLFLGFIFCTPILLVLFCTYLQRHRDRLQTDTSYARKKRALPQAKNQLENTKQMIRSEKSTEFYSMLAKTLTELVADKLNLPPASLTSNNIGDTLDRRGVPPETVVELKECLELCDHARFSSASNTTDQMESVFKRAERIIELLEKQL